MHCPISNILYPLSNAIYNPLSNIHFRLSTLHFQSSLANVGCQLSTFQFPLSTIQNSLSIIQLSTTHYTLSTVHCLFPFPLIPYLNKIYELFSWLFYLQPKAIKTLKLSYLKFPNHILLCSSKWTYCENKVQGGGITTGFDGGPRSWVCACLTLRSAPHWHQR